MCDDKQGTKNRSVLQKIKRRRKKDKQERGSRNVLRNETKKA